MMYASRMMRWFCGVCVLLCTSSALAIAPGEVPNPRGEGGWVADMADIIDPATEARLNALISASEAASGIEIAVVTVEAVSTPTPKDFATELFNLWHIGKVGEDNGLLVLMVVAERRLEMETGYGLEADLTDGWLRSMQQRTMVPAFRNGDYGDGLERGVQACIRRLGGEETVAVAALMDEASDEEILSGLPPEIFGPPPTRRQPAASAPRPPEPSTPWGWLSGLGLLFAGGLGTWRYRSERSCPKCKIRLAMVPDDEDHVHWDEGQQTEERLGSMDYQFHHCTQCDFSKVITSKKWFSGYSQCSSCSYRAKSTSSSTLRSATYSSTGLEEVTTHCKHCGDTTRHTRTIPQLQESNDNDYGGGGGGFGGGGGSFGGGGGGGSFGGGSSGGGGAGSSW